LSLGLPSGLFPIGASSHTRFIKKQTSEKDNDKFFSFLHVIDFDNLRLILVEILN